MYLYQDFLRLGEALKNEKEKQLLMEMRKRNDKSFQNDQREISNSFNPLCSICGSKSCTTAFNPKFKTCSHDVNPLM